MANKIMGVLVFSSLTGCGSEGIPPEILDQINSPSQDRPNQEGNGNLGKEGAVPTLMGVRTTAQLQVCDGETEGVTYLVIDESKLAVCESSKWVFVAFVVSIPEPTPPAPDPQVVKRTITCNVLSEDLNASAGEDYAGSAVQAVEFYDGSFLMSCQSTRISSDSTFVDNATGSAFITQQKSTNDNGLLRCSSRWAIAFLNVITNTVYYDGTATPVVRSATFTCTSE